MSASVSPPPLITRQLGVKETEEVPPPAVVNTEEVRAGREGGGAGFLLSLLARHCRHISILL